jgi:hypothetical protein
MGESIKKKVLKKPSDIVMAAYSDRKYELNNGAVLSPAKLSNMSEIEETSEKVVKRPLSINKSEP